MMQRREIVKLEDVWLYFDNMPVLEGINLSIKDRDFLGIIGPNGGGKTCLLKLILGLLKPSRGELTVFGHTAERSRKSVGYVPQYSLFDRDFPINVLDVVLMGRFSNRATFWRATTACFYRACTGNRAENASIRRADGKC
jgi:zinc transport system ATP-binding protein